MTIALRIKTYLEENGVKFEVLEHPTAYTAQEVAAATHVKGKELIKAVVVKADENFLLLVVTSERRIDFAKLKEVLGIKDVRLAAEQEFVSLFPDSETGAMPPFGNLYNVRMLVDESVKKDKEIAFNAGTHRDVIKISLDDYLRLVKPEISQFTIHL